MTVSASILSLLPPQNCTVDNSIFQEKARRVIEAPEGRVSESEPGRCACSILGFRGGRSELQLAGGQRRPGRAPGSGEAGRATKSFEDVALSDMKPNDLQKPRQSSWAGRGTGRDNGSLKSPATGCVKAGKERDAGGHSGSAGTASSGFICLGRQNLDFDHQGMSTNPVPTYSSA